MNTKKRKIPIKKINKKIVKEKVLATLKTRFKPEFLNRFDELIVFDALNKKDLDKIIELQIREINKRLKDKDIKIKLSTNAKDFLLKKGYDPAYGARPLRRVIQKYILDELALLMIKGKIKTGKVIVSIKNNSIYLKQ